MAFTGWPVEALEFYEGLQAENTKVYWQANKTTYDEVVRAPMQALLTELEPEFGAGWIFRPFRDVRFSRDKSPYKTNIAATLEHGGYIQLSAEGLAAAGGMYGMAPDQLARYRNAVDDEVIGKELEGLVEDLNSRRIEITGHGRLKTAPKGWSKDHPRIELLRLKGLVAWKPWPVAAWLGTAGAKRRVVELFRTIRPLNDWLADHVGPSTEPPDERR